MSQCCSSIMKMKMKSNIIFLKCSQFQSFHELAINLRCNTTKRILSIRYKPVCHSEYNERYLAPSWLNLVSCSWWPKTNSVRARVFDAAVKLNPPPEPIINFTTISWLPNSTKNMRLTEYGSELQFKQKDQPWSVCMHFVSMLVCE